MQETKRPSKEMQVTIAKQLGLEPTTVGNFFMNARRRSMDKWKDEEGGAKSPGGASSNGGGSVSMSPSPTSSTTGGADHHVMGHSDHISHGSLHHSLATDALWQQQNLIAYSQWEQTEPNRQQQPTTTNKNNTF